MISTPYIPDYFRSFRLVLNLNSLLLLRRVIITLKVTIKRNKRSIIDVEI